MREGARTRLIHSLGNRTRQLQELKNRYWTVHGEGPLGDKAQELMDKSWAIEQAGFTLIPRTVLAMGSFSDFRKGVGFADAEKNNYYEGDWVEAYRFRKRLLDQRIGGPDYWRLLHETIRRHNFLPLCVRSSAFGDSRGTGIYDSEIVIFPRLFSKKPELLIDKAIREVLLSEISENAVQFRRVNGLAPGMGVMIEPAFGTEFNVSLEDPKMMFGPAYGGFAHTSDAAGRIRAFASGGIPVEAVNGKGFVIHEDHKRLNDAIDDATCADRTCTYKNMDPKNRINPDMGKFCNLDLGIMERESVPNIKVGRIALEWFFEKLRRLESLVGERQYVEWALSADQRLAIMQISDAKICMDLLNIEISGKTVGVSEYVVGTGERTCDSIVVLENVADVPKLKRLNGKMKNYLLIYGGHLTSYECARSFNFSDVCNAAVLIEKEYKEHGDAPENHWGGALDASNKIFLVSSPHELPILQQKPDYTDGGFRIYHKRVKVTASQAQRKAVVDLVE